MGSLFDDGMTLPFTIEAKGPFDEITGKYRLAAPERTAEWHFDAYEKAKNGKERHKANVLFIAEHLIQWSAGVPINEETVRKIPQPNVVHLCNLIAAYSFDGRSNSEKN